VRKLSLEETHQLERHLHKLRLKQKLTLEGDGTYRMRTRKKNAETNKSEWRVFATYRALYEVAEAEGIISGGRCAFPLCDTCQGGAPRE
jgi:hypothetical protein